MGRNLIGRCLLSACVALCLGAVMPLAAGERYEIRFIDRDNALLGVVNGKVRAVRTTYFHDWDLSLAKGIPISLRVLAPEKWLGSYLASDSEATGKDQGNVFLADKKRPRPDWLLSRVKEETREIYTIQ